MLHIDKNFKDICTGCNMCGDICPVGAIGYIEDEEGFKYPNIDKTKCINCGKCEKRCPVIKDVKPEYMPPQIYASWSLEESVRLKSTSGGIFYELAKQILDEGGVVAGAVYSDDWKSAYHVLTDDVSCLEKIVGSKYFQSDLQGVYLKIRDCIRSQKKVLFCGTPCQSVALQEFLKDEKQLNLLTTVDFICLGINSPLAFKSFISEMEEKYNSEADYVQLKNKKKGWKSLATYIHFKNGEEYLKTVDDCKWITGYIMNGGMFIRKSCYDCKFRTIPRVSDISLGDFWGVCGCSEDDNMKGISAVLVNSKKGDELFKRINKKIYVERKNYNELIGGNPAIEKSPVYSEKRRIFFEYLKVHGFEKTVDLLCEKKVGYCHKMKRDGKVKALLRKIKSVINRVTYLVVHRNTISVSQYIYLNYFCKNIIREDGCHIIPYKGAIIDLAPTSKIYIRGRNLEIGINKLKGSKAETHVRLWDNAIWYANNGCGLFYNTVLEVCENAKLKTGYFTANGGSVIISAKEIVLGEDVMLGRNVLIYDSDHHQVFGNNMKMSNFPKKVEIGDHVWLTSNIIVQKGVTIGRDSIVAAFTTVNKSISEFSFVAGKSIGSVISEINGWSRESSNV